MTDCTASPQAALVDFVELANFAELADFTELAEKGSNSWKRFKPTEKVKLTEKGFLLPRPTPIYKQSMLCIEQNISIGHLGLAAWLCYLPALVHQFINQK